MVDLKTNFNNPLTECRLFADLTLLNHFGYCFNQDEFLGFSGGLDFLYSFCKNKGNSYFSIFGKSNNALRNFCCFVSGEWYCEYNGTIEDLAVLTNDYNIPVIVQVDFCNLNKYYKNVITKALINRNISAIKRFNVLTRLPHEVIVLGITDSDVLCGDNVSNQILKIPRDEFVNIWYLPKPEYGNSNKFYYEYVVLPQIVSIESLERIKDEIIYLSLKKVILNMENTLKWDQEVKLSTGLTGIECFINDLDFILNLPRNNQEFSYELLGNLDQMYFKGMFRKAFAKFLSSNSERIKKDKKISDELDHITEIYIDLANLWKKLIYQLNYDKLIKEGAVNMLKDDLYSILDKERTVVSLLGEIINF